MCQNRCRYCHPYTGDCTYKGNDSPCDMFDGYDEAELDTLIDHELASQFWHSDRQYDEPRTLAEAMAKLERLHGGCYVS